MFKTAALWLWRFLLARLGYLKVPTPSLARVVVVKQTEAGLWCVGIGPVGGEVVASVELDDWQAEALIKLIERTAADGQ